jgi:hypothetical protein
MTIPHKILMKNKSKKKTQLIYKINIFQDLTIFLFENKERDIVFIEEKELLLFLKSLHLS